MTRLGRAHAQGLWKLATAWSDAYHARFETPALEGGFEPPRALEQAAQVSEHWEQVADQALMAVYRRQQELIWTEHLVEPIETALDEAGLLPTTERVPAMVFLDLVGYTNLTEERGDEAAADLAGTFSVLVERSSRDHGGTAVK